MEKDGAIQGFLPLFKHKSLVFFFCNEMCKVKIGCTARNRFAKAHFKFDFKKVTDINNTKINKERTSETWIRLHVLCCLVLRYGLRKI